MYYFKLFFPAFMTVTTIVTAWTDHLYAREADPYAGSLQQRGGLFRVSIIYRIIFSNKKNLEAVN
jgi:hypothetical protein